MDKQRIERAMQQRAKEIARSGRLIEFNWNVFQRLAFPADISAGELHERRLAFLAGAESTFCFVNQLVQSGDDCEVTRIVDRMVEETRRIQAELQLRYGATQGNA